MLAPCSPVRTSTSVGKPRPRRILRTARRRFVPTMSTCSSPAKTQRVDWQAKHRGAVGGLNPRRHSRWGAVRPGRSHLRFKLQHTGRGVERAGPEGGRYPRLATRPVEVTRSMESSLQALRGTEDVAGGRIGRCGRSNVAAAPTRRRAGQVSFPYADVAVDTRGSASVHDRIEAALFASVSADLRSVGHRRTSTPPRSLLPAAAAPDPQTGRKRRTRCERSATRAIRRLKSMMRRIYTL